MSILAEETEIKPVKSARYLGIIFDHQLKWRSHIHHIEDKTATRICLLRFLSKLNLQANEQIMINLYKSLVRSVITYGCTVLLKADNSIWKRVQILQKKALRAALGLPIYTSTEYIHLRTKVPMITDYAKEILNKAISRAGICQDNNTTTEN